MADEPVAKAADNIIQLPPNSFSGNSGPLPVMNAGMTFSEIGNSGLRAFGGWVREEFLPNLTGRQAQVIYREMRDNSPVVGGMIQAIEGVMRKSDWRVNPANDTPAAQEAADFVDSLRTDMGDRTWEDTVAEALSMVWAGFAPLEIVYKRRQGRQTGFQSNGAVKASSKYTDGKIGWAKLPLRGQDTVLKWFFDPYGEVLGLTQQPYVGPVIDIPARKFLLFRPSAHKNNPEGRSALRNSYRPYFMVKRMEEQEAIMYERLSGVPVLKVPTSVMMAAKAGDPQSVALLNEIKAAAINIRIDEQMGIVLPSDPFPSAAGGYTNVPMYSVELMVPGGGKSGSASSGSDTVITRHQTNMLMSMIADFLTLGHGARGTQALATAKQDMFFQACEGFLNSAGAVFNNQGLDRLWELNGDDPDLMPEIVPDLAQRVDLDVLSNFILRLAQSGMPLFPNADLQSALMDSAGLPDIADTDAADFLYDENQKPVPIVGPGAAALMPTPPAPGGGGFGAGDGSPSDKLAKMIMGSWARRVVKMGGINPGSSRGSRKRRMPSQADLFAG